MLYRCVAAIPNNGGGCIEHFYPDNAEGRSSAAVSYTHLTLPTILLV